VVREILKLLGFYLLFIIYLLIKLKSRKGFLKIRCVLHSVPYFVGRACTSAASSIARHSCESAE
jgi:hypothetical protein